MLGFATAIVAESALKNGIFAEIIGFLVCITALPNLQINFQTHVILSN